jgi:hypothetical protein
VAHTTHTTAMTASTAANIHQALRCPA